MNQNEAMSDSIFHNMLGAQRNNKELDMFEALLFLIICDNLLISKFQNRFENGSNCQLYKMDVLLLFDINMRASTRDISTGKFRPQTDQILD